MPNKVFINEKGHIETIFVGDQTADSLKEVIEQYRTFIAAMLPNTHANIIVDLEQLGETDLGARRTAFVMLPQLSYHKVAVFGGNSYSKSMAKLVINAFGPLARIRYFENRAAAERWLATDLHR